MRKKRSSKKIKISEAARIIKKGGVVAYPTETVYGLGADPRNRKAIRKIFQVKGRDEGKPILILISSPRHLKSWVEGVTKREKELIKVFWPGPLTLVFRAKKGVPSELTAGSGKIGIRISSNKTAHALCRASGGAITSTSANLSGEPACTTSMEVEEKLGDKLDAIVSSSKKSKQISSTLLDVSEDKIKVLREGMISVSKITRHLQRRGFQHVESQNQTV